MTPLKKQSRITLYDENGTAYRITIQWRQSGLILIHVYTATTIISAHKPSNANTITYPPGTHIPAYIRKTVARLATPHPSTC